MKMTKVEFKLLQNKIKGLNHVFMIVRCEKEEIKQLRV